jgi:hypothetical protein
MIPVLECSIALLAAILALCLAQSLLKARILVHTAAEKTCLALWPRLAIAQTLIFIAMERAEGRHAGLSGAAVQILVALAVSYVLSLFTRVLVACAQCAEHASRYLARLLQTVNTFVSRRPTGIAYALAVHAGTARFQRPPPFA